MDGAIFLQQVVNGMSLGGMYALIAIGYTMVYGVLRLINFAHADVMMVGAFSTLFLFSSVGLPFGVAVFLTLGLCGLFGMLIDRVAYRPLRQASKISMLITAIGVSFFLENLFNVLFGGSSRFFSAPDFFDVFRALLHQLAANLCRAGKGRSLRTSGLAGQFAADGPGGTGDHVEHPGGDPGAIGQFGQRQR